MSDARPRADYRAFYPITTRWSDNDMYGHVNNVHYYSYFDSAVNRHLIEVGGLSPVSADVIGVVAESSCRYLAPLMYPSDIEAGLCVEHLGNRSVRYGIGIFKAGSDSPAAQGQFVHVFVDRASFKAVPIPDGIRQSLESITL